MQTATLLNIQQKVDITKISNPNGGLIDMNFADIHQCNKQLSGEQRNEWKQTKIQKKDHNNSLYENSSSFHTHPYLQWQASSPSWRNRPSSACIVTDAHAVSPRQHQLNLNATLA